MIEILRTADPVLLSWLDMIFRERGIKIVVLDEHASTLYGGALDAVARRIMVDDADLAAAEAVLADARALGADV
jgi:hypothetical protein